MMIPKRNLHELCQDLQTHVCRSENLDIVHENSLFHTDDSELDTRTFRPDHTDAGKRSWNKMQNLIQSQNSCCPEFGKFHLTKLRIFTVPNLWNEILYFFVENVIFCCHEKSLDIFTLAFSRPSSAIWRNLSAESFWDSNAFRRLSSAFFLRSLSLRCCYRFWACDFGNPDRIKTATNHKLEKSLFLHVRYW